MQHQKGFNWVVAWIG